MILGVVSITVDALACLVAHFDAIALNCNSPGIVELIRKFLCASTNAYFATVLITYVSFFGEPLYI